MTCTWISRFQLSVLESNKSSQVATNTKNIITESQINVLLVGWGMRKTHIKIYFKWIIILESLCFPKIGTLLSWCTDIIATMKNGGRNTFLLVFRCLSVNSKTHSKSGKLGHGGRSFRRDFVSFRPCSLFLPTRCYIAKIWPGSPLFEKFCAALF